MSKKKKSEDNLSLEDKLRVLEELNVFHNNPKKSNSKVTKEYKNRNFKFEIEFFEGVRLFQVDMDKHEIVPLSIENYGKFPTAKSSSWSEK